MPLPNVLSDPLPPLPGPIDRAARAWAGTTGRVRALLRLLVAVVALLWLAGGLIEGPDGPRVTTLVTVRAVPAGQSVTTADVAVARRPADLVPVGALTSVSDLPPHAWTIGPLPLGAAVTAEQLVANGPAGLADAGTAVVAIEESLLPPLPVGTRLDLAVPAFDGTMLVAATGAAVVGDDGGWRWIRVRRAEVAAVAAGVRDGQLVSAVLPRSPDDEP